MSTRKASGPNHEPWGIAPLRFLNVDTELLQGLKKLWNLEARACIGLQKNLDFINKNVRLDWINRTAK